MLPVIKKNIPLPRRGARGRTQVAKQMEPGDVADFATHNEATSFIQAMVGWQSRKTGWKASQRKLFHDGAENTTEVVPVGEYFWRVWRVK